MAGEPSSTNQSSSEAWKSTAKKVAAKRSTKAKRRKLKADASRLNIKHETNKRPVTCNLCGYTAKAPSSLTHHMRKHTNEKPYQCTVCDFRTGHQGALHKHERHHTGDKPYRCNLCPFSASYSSLLRYHMRTHTGVKPFECALCEFKSAHLGSLHSHLKIHEGIRPYSCDTCNFTAAYRCMLKKHVQKCTGKSRAAPKKKGIKREFGIKDQPHAAYNPSTESSASQQSIHVYNDGSAKVKSDGGGDGGDANSLLHTAIHSEARASTSSTSTDRHVAETIETVSNSAITFNADSLEQSAVFDPKIFVCSECNYITLAYRDLQNHKVCHTQTSN